jgi:hypothetical protein
MLKRLWLSATKPITGTKMKKYIIEKRESGKFEIGRHAGHFSTIITRRIIEGDYSLGEQVAITTLFGKQAGHDAIYYSEKYEVVQEYAGVAPQNENVLMSREEVIDYLTPLLADVYSGDWARNELNKINNSSYDCT